MKRHRRSPVARPVGCWAPADSPWSGQQPGPARAGTDLRLGGSL